MSAPVIDGESFAYADVEGDTFTAWVGDDGEIYVRNATADEGTSVVIVLSDTAASALAMFLASVTK